MNLPLSACESVGRQLPGNEVLASSESANNRDGLLLVNEMPRDWGRSVIRVSRAPTE
ncbi:MAG: hypothetical protein WB989_00445 [Mycobacterium sp.]